MHICGGIPDEQVKGDILGRFAAEIIRNHMGT